MDRREYLKRLIGVAGVGALAGCSALQPDEPTTTPAPPPETTSRETTTTPPREYANVVDVVEAGADPSGHDRVDDVLESVVADDTKLVFPEGRYRLANLHLAGYDNLGLVGDDATFVPDLAGKNVLLSFQQVADLHLEGFTVDQTGDDACGWIDVRAVGGRNVVRDVTLHGRNDVDGRTNGFTLLSEGADTDLLLDRVDLGDGGVDAVGIYVFPQRAFFDSSRDPGAITFRDCTLAGWRREGLYGSPHGGPIRVVGGEYRNNGIVQVRVGGGNAGTEALIRDVSVVVDDPPAYITSTRNRNMRGIWLEEGDGVTVEGATVDIRDVGDGDSQGGIVISQQFGRVTIRNTTVRTNQGVTGISIEAPETQYDARSMPSLDRLPDEWTVTCDNVALTGDSEQGAALTVVGRDGCVFRNLDVDQPRGTRHGLLAVDAADVLIEGGRWVTSGYPLLVGVNDAAPDDGCMVSLQGVEEFDGTNVDDGTVLGADEPSVHADAGRYCLPVGVVGGPSSQRHRLPFVGVTGLDSQRLHGRLLVGRPNGNDLVKR